MVENIIIKEIIRTRVPTGGKYLGTRYGTQHIYKILIIVDWYKCMYKDCHHYMHVGLLVT